MADTRGANCPAEVCSSTVAKEAVHASNASIQGGDSSSVTTSSTVQEGSVVNGQGAAQQAKSTTKGCKTISQGEVLKVDNALGLQTRTPTTVQNSTSKVDASIDQQ